VVVVLHEDEGACYSARGGIYVLSKYDICLCGALHVAVRLTSSIFWFKLWQLEERPTRDLFSVTAMCQVFTVKSGLKNMKLESLRTSMISPKIIVSYFASHLYGDPGRSAGGFASVLKN
jgi:hypothetical protein